MNYIYPAVFYPEDDGRYSVIFPDLNDLATYGDSLADAFAMAGEACSQYLFTSLRDGEDLPAPSDLDAVEKNNENAIVNMVCVNLDDSTLIDEMKRTYQELWNDLELLVQQDKLSEFEKSAVKAMCRKVEQALSANYNNVKEGVDIVMGGKILDYEAKRIKNECDVQAVVNMLILDNDEMKVREMYPEQFEAGKKAFEESKLAKA